MRNLLLASVAVLALGAAVPAMAQDKAAGAAAGGTVGGVAGGTIGFFLGGPIGAIIGGFTGATIGASAGVSASTVDYAAKNPVDPVYLDADVDVGYTLGDKVKVYDVEGDPKYGYVYANNRVYIVDRNSRKIVHSPGYVIPSRTVEYVQAHPTADIAFSGDVAPGVKLSGDFNFGAIPDDPGYSYVYIHGRPVLVDNRSRVIVWTD
jgi:hypothetical protein